MNMRMLGTICLCYCLVEITQTSLVSSFGFKPLVFGNRHRLSTPIATLAVQGSVLEKDPLPRPTSLSYWVSENLLAGEHPTHPDGIDKTREKIQRYLDCGITYFVDLTQVDDKGDYQEIVLEEAMKKGLEGTVGCTRVTLQELGTSQMDEVLNAIDAAIANQHKVYVHCRGGNGRTGTTVGCYLVRHGSSGEEAVEQVNRLFQASDPSRANRSSPENPDQVSFIRQWK